MNCENINNFIHDYFDNELSTEQESFLFTHLAQCEGCKANFKTLNRVQFEFRKEESEFPEQLEERIFNTIRNKEYRRSYEKDDFAFSLFISRNIFIVQKR